MNQTRRAGLVLALVTATVSAFSVYVNGMAVRLFDSATVYTTGKNLIAAMFLGLVAALVAQRSPAVGDRRFRPRGAQQWLGLAAVGVVGGSVPFVLFFEGLSRASSSPYSQAVMEIDPRHPRSFGAAASSSARMRANAIRAATVT